MKFKLLKKWLLLDKYQQVSGVCKTHNIRNLFTDWRLLTQDLIRSKNWENIAERKYNILLQTKLFSSFACFNQERQR